MADVAFGKYRLEALLGRGGMGEVWRAFDTTTERTVAVKVLPAHLADDEMFQKRFRREARAAAGLFEPHVVPIHGYGEIDGRLYVDMRLVVGRDLDAVLREGPVDPARAVMIVEQVASALHAAHQIGLLHRDVKPSNILITDADFAYLIDFGIARVAGETGLTSTGSTLGTWAYMAPERFGAGEPDHRSDVYALACVLHQCLTGRLPFTGTNVEQQVAGHLATPPPRPSAIAVGVPAAFDDVIAAGMAKNPDERYPTTMQLAQAARSALMGTSEPVHPTLLAAAAPEAPPVEPQPRQGGIPDSDQSAIPDERGGTSSVAGAPNVSRGEASSHPAPEVAVDRAADTLTQAGPTISGSHAPTQQAPVAAGKARLAEVGKDDTQLAAAQAIKDRGVLARYSPREQAAISAALLIPSMAIYFIFVTYIFPQISDRYQSAAVWGVLTLIYGVYFVNAVGFAARNRQRRKKALLFAAVAVFADTAYSWYDSSPTAFHSLWRTWVVFTLLLAAYAAAWGIARRQHRRWKIGLALATVVCGVWLAFTAGLYPGWFGQWVHYPGAFTLGCLICWAFDVAGRRRDLKSPATP